MEIANSVTKRAERFAVADRLTRGRADTTPGTAAEILDDEFAGC